MFETIRHLAWFTILACAIAFVVLVFVGKLVFAQAAGEHDPILVRDELGPSSHHLSGMVAVPSSCDELQERVEALSSTTYTIVLTTWREPSVPCQGSKIPRAFRDALFAPATGVAFTAVLDGAPIPILVLPVRPADLRTSSLDARSPVINH